MRTSDTFDIREGSSTGSQETAPRVQRMPLKKRLMLWVRKTHMYLGLLLFPWVIFFGVSGMLFNHPGVGESVRARPLSPEVLRARANVLPLDASQIARDVVAHLRSEGGDYRVDAGFAARLHGSTAFASTSGGEKHLLLLHLPTARGVVLTRPDRTPDKAPFAQKLRIPRYDLEPLGARMAELLPTAGSDHEVVAPTLRIAPSLRFRMLDAQGQAWNVTYDLGTGELDGRPSERSPELSLHDLLGEMHKTHHFPPETGPGTFWALFADLTGLTLILWALTGLIMWWQLKRTRALGVMALSVGLFVAALTMLGTHAELRFGNVRPEEPGAVKR